MRRTKTLAFVVLILITLLAACSDFTRNTYRTQVVTKSAYDVILSGMGDLYHEGLIDEGVRDQAIKFGRAYKKAHNDAVEALAVYEEQGGEANQQAAMTAMQLASKSLAELISYARPYLQKYDKEVP